MNIAVVILNWNGKELLEKFLPAVVKYSQDAAIYVVDNASTDNSLHFLAVNYPRIAIIKHQENKGYAEGYNAALRNIDAEVYCLLNSDVEVTRNWLTPMVKLFQEHDNIAVVQPKILDYVEKEYFEYAGAAGGYIDALGYPFCRGRVFNTIEKDKGQYDKITKIFWASGACFFIRSEVFHQLRGFDEDYFAHQEEIDLCWRIHHLGFDVFYHAASVVYHLGGATLKNTSAEKTFLNYRNSLFSLVKNLPKRKMVFVLCLRFMLDGFSTIRFLGQCKWIHAMAIIKAQYHFFRTFSRMKKKREHRNIHETYYHTKSIVWSYFIRRKKHFQDLIKY